MAHLCADMVRKSLRPPRGEITHERDRRFLLPILGEYSDSGYRDTRGKLLYSLRENAQFLAVILGAGILGLIYVFITYGVSVTSLKGLVMALAYVFGLLMAVYLMGHGLVSIPRRLIRNASVSGRLRRLQSRAPRVYENMEDSLISLEEIEFLVTELGRRKVGSAMEFRDWIEELQETTNQPEPAPRMPHRGEGGDGSRIPTVITEKFMADISRKLMRARQGRSRYVTEWDNLVQEAAWTQEILDSAASKKLDYGGAAPHSTLWDRTKFLTPHSRYLWHFHVTPYLQVMSGVFLALASACIVWSELVKFAMPKLSVIRVSVIHHWVGERAEVGFAGQAISAFWICYMCAAALMSMTEVKVWRGRALVKRNTAYESAFWYAMQVAKLSIPLAYNFMTFLTSSVYEKTVFYQFLGKSIDLTPLGRRFNDFFPILVLFPVLATLFGLYSKVKRVFVGVDVIDDDDENINGYGTGSWREGRDLIERELGGNSSLRRREDTFARLAQVANSSHRAAPILSVPVAGDSGNSASRSGVRPSTGASRPTSARAHYSEEQEDDDSNFFQLMGHRMKNTIDTLEAPKWFQEIGQGMKKPKWMGGNNEERPRSGQRNDSDYRRWFGSESGVRLL